ncbi:MAG TPA: hypothetical protein VFF06_14270 [Polyangia bacterium]|nr:hypothetical protein [Polyangia bacterium]
MAFGFVVDDRGPDKTQAGGALQFAARLAESPLDEAAHVAACPACGLLGRFACVGAVPSPLAAAVEKWLVERLPEDLESVGGFLLRKAIGDFGYDGARARELRKRGGLAAPGPFERHYGPFFRRFVVSSEQILEELVCAGDVAPSHGLAVLMHLGALEVDGRVPTALDDGQKLGELIEHPRDRRARTRFTVAPDGADEPSLAGVKALLAALWAGFVLDADVYVRDSDEVSEPAPPAA